MGPGLIATVLSLAAASFLIISGQTPILGALVDAAVFAAVGLGMALFGGRLHRSHRVIAERSRELLAREAHLRSILDTVPDAMIVIDERG